MTTRDSIELLVVDDDDEFRQTVYERFRARGHHVQQAANGEQALEWCQRREFDVAVVDVMMPGMSGLELLKKLRSGHSMCEVIMLTGQGSIETAVEAMKAGAYDFITKPFPLRDLEALIEKAYERRKLRKENEQLRAILKRSQTATEMVGKSPQMQQVFRLIERAGPSEKAILIQGESGTGKELVAKALHRHSPRAEKPFVVINCAALPETLLESELFGHEKGAFTGAVTAKPGLFEVADGGTLFIDEIGELPGALQAKLLRVLEDGSFRRIGSIKERRVNVRLLSATNRRLFDDVMNGRFREDLYYRINVMSLELPPIRERAGDIPLLVEHFLGSGWEVAPDAMRMLEHYPWPGNIRQLINALERAKIMADGPILQVDDFPPEVVRGTTSGSDRCLAITDDLAEIARAKIVEVLRKVRGNKTQAAVKLGIDRRKLYRLLSKYEIRPREWQEASSP